MILAPPPYELPVYAWQLEAIAFFDHILRGTGNGYGEQPPVRYWLDGEERFVGVCEAGQLRPQQAQAAERFITLDAPLVVRRIPQ